MTTCLIGRKYNIKIWIFVVLELTLCYLSRLDQPPKYDKDMIKQWCEDICDSDVNQPIKPKEDSCTSHMATTNSDSSIDYETSKISYSVNINKVDVLEKNDSVLK